jgi:hypothetical protein
MLKILRGSSRAHKAGGMRHTGAAVLLLLLLLLLWGGRVWRKAVFVRMVVGRGRELYVQRVEMIVEIFNLKAWYELCEQSSTFFELSLELVCVPTGLERLTMTILLGAFDACSLTRATIGQHRVALYFLPPATCAGFMKSAESARLWMGFGIVSGGGRLRRTTGIVVLLSFL